MQFNQAHINTIMNARDNDNLVVFVGAGVSKFSETSGLKFPFWGDLIDSLKQDLETTESDYLKVSQLYFLKFGEYSLYERLKQLIPLHANPSDIHKKIFELNPKYVITTNWDNILEKTIEQNGHIFDVIKSDADLVKSVLPRKLLKVHGDFASHNIVFKEDDYLRYSDDFPLVENFLKHILSSYTVLFLGYSYSDYDLKIISKWIERRSKVAPPRFILSKEENSTESMYLSNHGIQSIFPIEKNNINLSYFNVYDSFLDTIKSKSSIPFNLLSFIQKYDENETKLTAEIKVNVVNYIHEKLNGLIEFEALLPEQIRNVLSNCSIEFHFNCFGLWFHDSVMTRDYEENERKIYKVFFKILAEYPDYTSLQNNQQIAGKLTAVFKVFYSAGCHFVTNQNEQNEWIDIKDYLSERDLEELNELNQVYEDFISFAHSNDLLMGFIPVTNGNKERNLNIYKDIISQTNDEIHKNLQLKKFYKAIIAMFNLDVVTWRASFNFDIDFDEQKQFYNQESQWRSKLNMYPANVKKHIEGLHNFLNLDYLYYYYHDNHKDLKKLSQGFLVDSHDQRSNDRCQQVLRFMALNEVMIENHTIFKDLMTSFATLKLKKINSNANSKFPTNKSEVKTHDLFVLIKYFDFKKLTDLIDSEIYKPLIEKEALIIDFTENKEYLLTTFQNLNAKFETYPESFHETVVSKSLVNSILLNAFVEWNDEELDEIIKILSQTFTKNNMPYNAYEAINLFIFYNYKIFKISSEKTQLLLDIPLNKILFDSINPLELNALESDFNNVFGILTESDSKVVYQNDVLISRVIGVLSPTSKDIQRKIARQILIKYLPIVGTACKEKLLKYLNSIRIESWSKSSSPELVIEELTFNSFGCETNQNFINFLENYLLDGIDRIKSNPIITNYIRYLAERGEKPEYVELENKINDRYSR